MQSPRPAQTLIELLLTIAILGILAGAIIPCLSSDIPDRLSSVAQIVATDLDYARSLAVANGSKYLLIFDTAANYYFLQHTGTNAVLNTLPLSPFRSDLDDSETQTTDLTKLPIPAPSVELVVVLSMQSGGRLTTELEFTPLGGTTAVYDTVIWLSCGRGTMQRFISVSVNPITGLVTIGPVLAELPANVASLIGALDQTGALKSGKTNKGKGNSNGNSNGNGNGS